MPIYEYECAACGCRHEILQKVGEAPLRDCPDCGEPELVKLVSVAGFRLAGGGWYETDFKTGAKRNLAGNSTGADANGKPSGDQPKKSDKPAGGGKETATASKSTAGKGSSPDGA